jgi:hypothetical protein
MFQRIANGWELMKQSFGVLRHDKELVLFPMMSGVACLLVVASFAVPLWSMPWFRQAVEHKDIQQNPVMWALLFAFYVVSYFVIVFFNAALVSCALKRLSGENPTVGYGLSQAMNRLPQIAAWALVSGTVGFLLKMIESRSERLGSFMASLIGAGWAIATYFVVPVLVVEKVGPWDALKRSTSMVRRTWGEALVGNMGIGLVMFVATLPGIAMIMLGIVIAGATGQMAWTIAGIAAGAIWIVGTSLVSAAVQSILLTALYLYASEGTAPPQFDAALLQSAFGQKK